MVRKRLDDRIRTLLERSVATGERSMLVLVGDHGKDQVPNLHALLAKTQLQARPSVLWCYKKDLGFSTHRKKRMKKLKRDKARGLTGNADDPGATASSSAEQFELFISQTEINWCYYKDSHRVLGTTVGVLVLQDFEAITPNLMARTLETVQGGGLIIFLFRTVKSLKQLYAMSMDVHARYRTESSAELVPRFNERFILSLSKCPNCLVCDDELNVLPMSKRALKSLGPSAGLRKGDAGQVLVPTSKQDAELAELQESLVDTPHVGVLVALTKTLDQAKAVLVFLEACADKALSMTVALTAARGRGKSAAMGLCLAGALSLGYSTICLTAPEPENLVAVFDFVLRGLKALQYQEHVDFKITYQVPSHHSGGRGEGAKCITSIVLHRSHRQMIQYVATTALERFSTAEIVAMDEAAAIPLPMVQALMKQKADRLFFLSSTVHGYEGTGRALSLKLIKELRESKGPNEVSAARLASQSVTGPKSKKGDAKVHEQRWAAAAAAVSDSSRAGLREMELDTPIRYAQGDPVEAWLNKLLCLDCGGGGSNNHNTLKLSGGAPAPGDCELYAVDRDALFSYHKLSEAFLQKMMGLYTSAHYKNTPNDLQMLSDAPSHSAFVLLSPSAEQDSNSLPDVLAVIQVALEGRISRKAVEAQLSRGHRSAGDLIPWTLSQQFGDSKFAQLSGARIVRIAVHPSVQGMGYGSRAMELLYRYYNGDMISLANRVEDKEDDDDEEMSHEKEAEDEDDEDESDDEDGATKGSGLQSEKLKPREKLPPLLLPLTEVEAPRLDWIGTSFGLTLSLHKFWTRAGMHLLYLRQTKNELTGEHSAVMARSLSKRTGFDDSWLPAFLSDTKRRLINLMAGPFRDMDVRASLSLLEHTDGSAVARGDEKTNQSIIKRAGASVGKITADELDYLLTPHDLKRLEQYGRNLCDHHLVADLLPVLSKLYFLGRLGPDLQLSSVQGALLCGIGLQNHTVDVLTKELGLPANQVLAMFNKAVKKISIALNVIVEDKEKQAMLQGEGRSKAEQTAFKMRNVAEQTLEEDNAEGAKEAMLTLAANDANASLPPEIAHDKELMRYVVKGSEEQWKKVLDGKEEVDGSIIQIESVREKREKRKAAEAEDSQGGSASKNKPASKKTKKGKKKGRHST